VAQSIESRPGQVQAGRFRSLAFFDLLPEHDERSQDDINVLLVGNTASLRVNYTMRDESNNKN
jgi:hypothetical protein